MKLLHVIHDFVPRHCAGTEIHVLRLCRTLARHHQVAVLCADFQPQLPHGSVRRRQVDGLPVWEVINNWIGDTFEATYRDPAINRALRRVLRRLKPDVLHIHSLQNLSLDLPILAEGIHRVATLHDFSLFCPAGGQMLSAPEQMSCRRVVPGRCARCLAHSPYAGLARAGKLATSEARLRWLRRANGRLADRFPRGVALGHRLLSSAWPGPPVTDEDVRHRLDHAQRAMAAIDRFVAPSTALADTVVRLGLPADRLEVADYGTPTVDRAPGAAWTGGRPLRLGFVGTLAPHKGAHLAIDALGHLPTSRVELLIFGDPATSPHYASQLRRRAAGRPVTFGGAFAPDDLERVYRAFDLLVVPSLWPENSPLVIHEARAFGVPVVASRIGGIATLVHPGHDGLLFAPGSAADLARAVRRIVDHPPLLAQLRPDASSLTTLEQEAAAWVNRYTSSNRAGRSPAVDNRDRPDVSVLLLTRDGGSTLPDLLRTLDRQQTDLSVELVAVDSGSSDDTVSLLRHAGATVLSLPHRRFNHGATRNLGVRRCAGRFVVLLAQDAVPASERWLECLVRPMVNDPTLAGCHGHQLPTTDAGPITRFYAERGLPFELPTTPRAVEAPTVPHHLSPVERYRLCAFDNVCSCIRRSVWRQIPFRRVMFGEDIAWGQEVLLAGHRLLYAPDATVFHSHHRPACYELRRGYLAHHQLRRLFGLRTVPSAAHLPWAMVATLASNIGCLLRSPSALSTPGLSRAVTLALALPLGQYLGALAADAGHLPRPQEGV